MNATPDALTGDQIRSIYESGPEEVIALVRRLQSDLDSLTECVSKLEARENFDHFLLYLDADRERAAARYNELQRSLIGFFARCGSADPEWRAGEVLETLCRQVAEGKRFEDLEKYSIGVARNFLLKEREGRGSKQVSLSELQTDYDLRFSSPPPQALAEKEATESVRQECMSECVKELPDADRRLITEYSRTGGQNRSARETLAKKAGVSLDALRVRVHRIRATLKRCFLMCQKRR